jgi:hypothetical protein
LNSASFVHVRILADRQKLYPARVAMDEVETAMEDSSTASTDPFVQLQAILAGLPMRAVPAPVFSRSCGTGVSLGCAGERRPPPPVDSQACKARIQAALVEACGDYPEHLVLGQLVVEHASLDSVCLANHPEGQLFTAVRGTDRMLNPLTTPRDMQNDVLIALGMAPTRTAKALSEYRALRARFPTYCSYGTGHSLGGNIVEQLALSVEEETTYRFRRVDVFNTGASPLRQVPTKLTMTELHAHRVPGDWASMYHTPAGGKLHVHKPKTAFRSRHVLGHFLPEKAVASKLDPAQPVEEKVEEAEGADSDSDDEEVQPNRPTLMKPPPLWMSLLSCAGIRKPIHNGLTSGPRGGCLLRIRKEHADEDRWRNCEPPDVIHPGPPPKELKEFSLPSVDSVIQQPLVRPLVQSGEGSSEEEDSLPSSMVRLTLQIRLRMALDLALETGELSTAVKQSQGADT